MVFYFESNLVEPPILLYMGRDKHENEELIRWGWPEDIWFHVDKMSSAHVYLRMPEGMTIENLPEEVILDCAHLTKANSIQGCKENNVNIVYTPWANLKKTGDMDVGQVGFHKHKEVRNVMIEKKVNEIINRLNKTKVETEHENFRARREERDAKERKKLKQIENEQKAFKKKQDQEKQEQEQIKSYTSLMVETNMSSNIDNPIDEDDFM